MARRTVGYRPYLDKVIEEIGEVVLKDSAKLLVQLRQYTDLAPRISVIHEFMDHEGLHKESRIPRLTAKAALDLSELLATAADALQEIHDLDRGETDYNRDTLPKIAVNR